MLGAVGGGKQSKERQTGSEYAEGRVNCNFK